MKSFEFFGDCQDLETAKEFLTELNEAGLMFHPDDDAFDCLYGQVPRDELARIQNQMHDAYNAFLEADEDIHEFCIELDPDQLANRIESARQEMRDELDADSPDAESIAAFREDIERMEALQASRHAAKREAGSILHDTPRMVDLITSALSTHRAAEERAGRPTVDLSTLIQALHDSTVQLDVAPGI